MARGYIWAEAQVPHFETSLKPRAGAVLDGCPIRPGWNKRAR
jgi:hypothetical protein